MMQRRCGNCIYWSPNHKEHERCHQCGEGRVNFVPRDMKCPVPSCQSGMIYYKKDAYLACPNCGTEIWPFVMEKSDKLVIRQEFEKTLPCDRSPEVGFETMHIKAKKTGGGKSSKARTKNEQLLNKKSTTQIYKELAASKNKIIERKVRDTP